MIALVGWHPHETWDWLSSSPLFGLTLTLAGYAVGRWAYRRDARGRPSHVEVAAWRPWSPAERDALEAAVARFGRFVGGPVTWSWDRA